MSEEEKMLVGEIWEQNLIYIVIMDSIYIVVNKDIPSNVVAVGNPCKVLKDI